jgi:hypothetical protein
VVAAIKADNPYAAFTLLRSYAENAAAILYVTDKPETLERFWRGSRMWPSAGSPTMRTRDRLRDSLASRRSTRS